MSETNLGLCLVDSSRCVDQRRRTICHQMTSACTVCGASHWQLISFLDVDQRLEDSTLPGTPEHSHQHIYAPEFTCISINNNSYKNPSTLKSAQLKIF